MKYVIEIFTMALVFTNIKSLIRYIKAKSFLMNNKDTKINNTKKEIINIIIPVYHEVNNIKKSVEYFSKIPELCKVYYVTTSKEKDRATYNEVKRQIEEQQAKNIYLDNCPNTEGTMANQLNYIAKKFPETCIIAIYNIDSFPELKTFQYVINNIKEDEVYQQVSFFNNTNKGILKSAQDWQNRWSIIYEMGKYLENRGNSFVYTIGHGLFLRKSILDKCGYWSEDEINEDNEFGYRLLCNNIKIKPIPFMEQADFANSLSIYVKQQSTWVNGPLYAFSYFKKGNRKDIKNFWLTLLNFKAYVSWTFFPPVFLMLTIASAFYNYIYTLLIVSLMTIYLSICNFLTAKLLKKLNYITNKKITINILNDFAFFIVHCFGGIITIGKIIKGKNTKQNKYNTEK